MSYTSDQTVDYKHRFPQKLQGALETWLFPGLGKK